MKGDGFSRRTQKLAESRRNQATTRLVEPIKLKRSGNHSDKEV